MRLAFPDLLSYAARDVTVVLPSRLLAVAAELQIARSHLAEGEEAWERSSILSVNAWLMQSWAKARYRSAGIPSLLSPAQELVLWKRVMQEDGLHVFDLNATARLAVRAALTVAHWGIDTASDIWKESEDTRRFRHWHNRLLDICRDRHWITRAALWRELPGWIAKGWCDADRVLYILSGPATPAVLQIGAALGKQISLKRFVTSAPKQKTAWRSFESPEEEMEFAARWARARLDSQSQASLAIFVPDLAQHRPLVERSFQRVFYPATSCNSLTFSLREPADLAYSIDSGSSVHDEPLISGALLLLELARERISIADAATIFRSPWIAGADEERDLRAMADFQLRRRRELDVTFENLKSFAAPCPRLSRALTAAEPHLARQLDSAPFSRWSEFFGALLTSLGWPGERELTGREQVSLDGWRDALSDLNSLSLVAGPVSFPAALSELRGLLRTSGGPRNSLAPVQIIDSREAEGLQFDAALLAGLSQEAWPPAANPSPFVPLRLQRDYGVPEGSADSIREAHGQLTAALFSVAPDLYATCRGEPSPAVQSNLKKRTQVAPHWPGLTPLEAFSPAIPEELEDSQAPAYHLLEGTARGGTSIIKAQSACPFKAFVEYRLSANTPDEGCLGLDARERGGFLHRALEFVWQKLGSRDNLRALSPPARQALVAEAVESALANQPSSPFHDIVTAVEAERLRTVILEWLVIEADRQHPFEVITVEGEQQFDLAGLPLRLRIDRIDRLQNGKYLLIDYKSGAQTKTKLKGERPPEPQLLVYATALGNNVDGMLFAELKPRESRPVGFTREKQFRVSGTEALGPKWSGFLSDSQVAVTALAKGFLGGAAAVHPAPHACDYCEQKPLCRINESDREDAGEE